MRSHAAAVAWELGRRHRLGMSAAAVYLVALATIRLLWLAPGHRVGFDDDWAFAFVVIVPMSTTFMYFLAVFSFGLEGDLAGRESMYPSRKLTLPVTSAALAGWPMLYGTSAMALLWLATRLLGVWPADLRVPLVWPAVLAAAVLAWAQALTWMPYALPGLRVIVTVALLVMIDVVVFLALGLGASEGTMLAILAPNIPLAYLVAWFAVARARRGEAPDWRKIFAWLGRRAERMRRRTGRFGSAAHAQAWFEWRRHGRSLPLLVAILLPFELSMLVLFRETPVIVGEVIVAVMLTPPLMATFVAASVSRSSPLGDDSWQMTAFTATRPVTSASLVSAKLQATIVSTMVTWLIVLVAVPTALAVSGTSPVVIDGARRLAGIFGAPRAVAIGFVGLLAFVGATWKQLVQSLCIGMSGRRWLVKGYVFGTLLLLTLVFPLVHWVGGSRALIAALWEALTWILVALACVKISLASWAVIRLHGSGLVSERTLFIGALSWNVAALGLYGLLVWIVPMELIGSYLLAFVAILAIPLVRLAAIPLALDWNRHR